MKEMKLKFGRTHTEKFQCNTCKKPINGDAFEHLEKGHEIAIIGVSEIIIVKDEEK